MTPNIPTPPTPEIERKSPESLAVVRHGESVLNVKGKEKKASTEYQEFLLAFHKEWDPIKKMAIEESISAAMFPILLGAFPSDELKARAIRIMQLFPIKTNSADTPLTEKGRQQAEATGRGMAAAGYAKPDIIYVSPYLRTQETLKYLIAGWPDLEGVKISVEDRLREQDFGIQALFGDKNIFTVFHPECALSRDTETEYNFRYPGGEGLLDVQARVTDFLHHAYRRHVGEKILIVAHHLTLLALIGKKENWDREKFLDVDENDKPVNAGVTLFVPDPEPSRAARGKMIVKSYNQKLYTD